MAFFEGLVITEDGSPVEVAYVGGEWFYVIDDQGFRRHIDARQVDEYVLAQFLDQIKEHEGEASAAMLRMMGQDDLFTKGMVDATLRNISVDQMLEHRLPAEARELLGMMGFRVVIDVHGEVMRVDLPAAPDEGYEED
jgi:hypothetical protein